MNSELRILIGEDNDDEAFLLQRALLKAGVSNPTHICRHGQEVIDYLRALPPYSDRAIFPFPRMLILDLKMPGLSGLDVLRWIRRHPECTVIPTLILTSSAEESDVVEAYRIGANAYLTKPGGFDDFVETLTDLGKFWNRCLLPPSPPSC
jgi:CheY-like chemotaxis protein